MSTHDPKRPGHGADPETTGHEWDGISEFNNPLPRWWLWVFYICIIWGVGYSIAYPAWPGLTGASAGVLGWSSRAEFEEEIKVVDEKNAGVNKQLEGADLAKIGNDQDLDRYAVQLGASVFKTWCAQCHGAGAAGVKAAGYPNLLDDDWLWGGTIDDIYTTIKHGIRNEDDGDARTSEMPAFGDNQMLEPLQIEQVANFVMTLSGETPEDEGMVADGKTVFADNCAVCHGEDGKGEQALGAPNLTDKIWLYGGSYDTIMTTIQHGRGGVMPAWGLRLDDTQVRAVAIYVHQLGGGQ
ncbi:cytochrome-c oxidase, cbb3-type subunit III [Chachezhania sediminis]|uniref:cytochrome-c oxidase, cbb3-type subunit III n=1 Tax=Chachezhania sediminis TaxID=2599291 RepID=UPI00131C12B5|nr:cytochrome-c oxidase, cbb3-type subunit III [Chachezhania sediminis]